MNKLTIHIILILFLFTVSTCNSTSSNSNTVSKEENKTISIKETEAVQVDSIKKKPKLLVKGTYSNIVFCPNSNKFVFSKENGDDIFMLDKNSKQPIKILSKKGAGNNIGWSKDCNEIYFKEKTKDYKIHIKSINLKTLKITDHKNLDAGVVLSSIALSDTIYSLDQKTLNVYGSYNGKKTLITKEKGNYYNVLLSPCSKFIAVHKGSNVLLYSTSGEYIRELGKGIVTQWSLDSKYLIGFLDKSNDGELSSSDVYRFEIDKSTPTQITFTPDVFEVFPSFNTENEILYTDALHGGIYKIQN